MLKEIEEHGRQNDVVKWATGEHSHLEPTRTMMNEGSCI